MSPVSTGTKLSASQDDSSAKRVGGLVHSNRRSSPPGSIEVTCYYPSPICMHEPRADNEGSEGLPRPESGEAKHEEEDDEMGESRWATGNCGRPDRRGGFGRWRKLEGRRLLK